MVSFNEAELKAALAIGKPKLKPKPEMTQEAFDRDVDGMLDSLRTQGITGRTLSISSAAYAEMQRKGITRPDVRLVVGLKRKQRRKQK